MLTEAGHALVPVVIGLLEWGGRYATSEYGPSRLTHAGCGQPAHAEIHCEAGHKVAEVDLIVWPRNRRRLILDHRPAVGRPCHLRSSPDDRLEVAEL
jgi:hypothetical protein